MRSLTLLGDRYRLGPIIGTGGMGAVHRAYDERFGREVAVKVVRSGADEVERERLRREAQYLAGLDHPNLVAVYDAGWDHARTGETVWFAMELIEGPDLRHVLRDGGPLPTADTARVLEAAAGALGVLHEAGVVHRDLKPANVLLTAHPSSGRWDVKLADLGIAQLMRAEQLTSTGQVVGTAAYLSPEQVSGERVGPASDVYALGLLVIEALTGQVAFPGGPVESAAARLVRAPDVPRGIEPGWRTLLIDMTARKPDDRPTTGEILRRTATLQRSAAPYVAAATTAVLPIDDDAPTEAMAVQDTRVVARPLPVVQETGWTPSLRSRPRPRLLHRRRRAVLAAGALAVAVALAGGGAAVVGGGSEADASARTSRHGASSSPSTSSSPGPAASSPAAASAGPVTKRSSAPAPEQKQRPEAEAGIASSDDTTATARQRAVERLRRLQDRIEERLRERLSD